MNWDAVGAISEGVGATAVFVTLAYLAVQVRHAREEVRRTIYVQRQEAARELCLSRAGNEALVGDQLKAALALGGKSSGFVAEVAERAGLAESAALRLMWDEYAWWYSRVQQIPYVDDLPAGERASFDGGIRFNYGERPLARLWFETQKPLLSPDAVRYVESVLARSA